MGIALWFQGVTPAETAEILADNAVAVRVIRGNRPPPPLVPTITILERPEPGKPFEFPAWLLPPEYTSAVDRVYHIIHFILTGTAGNVAGPRGYMMSGGLVVRPEPELIRLLDPEQVREFAAVLDPITREFIHGACDFQTMAAAGVIWAKEALTIGDGESYVEQEFLTMKAFIEKVAKNGDGVLIYWG